MVWIRTIRQASRKQSLKRIDHIAVAVSSLEEALPFYQESLGLALIGIETVAEQGVRTAKLDAGNTHIELLEPLSPESPVGKFIAQRGQGLHHICFAIDDINAGLESLQSAGVKLIDREARVGAGGARIAFVHPKATGGVLVELSQDKDS